MIFMKSGSEKVAGSLESGFFNEGFIIPVEFDI